jgi:hypothetical protein
MLNIMLIIRLKRSIIFYIWNHLISNEIYFFSDRLKDYRLFNNQNTQIKYGEHQQDSAEGNQPNVPSRALYQAQVRHRARVGGTSSSSVQPSLPAHADTC